ncbi:serine/threonine-protein kinase EDR1-like isoform X2 [Tripterygium wilfordii]|uniref:serine/threonine-protein kinase EDR1-like isoform X2 n=1 Tax=Tripterygium wilfordii TaxID=458696 RepID=UPI0018F7E910|nr:serine/threonine-protein kinase EDR1-like isoform X2 [Tripterygium wilfordii]
MSKMKHLLRKLHIGGGLNEHQRLGEPRRSTNPINPSALSSTSASPTTSYSPSSVGTIDAVESGSGDRTAGRDGGLDFNFLEEEFQVQLALAISASDPDAGKDPDSVQIDAAKRISLGCTASVAGTDALVEFMSLRYWSYNVVNYDEKVMNGFYDVYGIASNPVMQGQMPILVDLQAISVRDNVDYEVVLVNRSLDPELRELERKVYIMYMDSRVSEHGQALSNLIQKIANIVVDRMGGPVGDADEMLRRWTIRSYELRNALNTIILPLGCLDIGLSRHRALLFKVLADKINLPCMLVKGSYYTGTDDGAVNLIRIANGSEYIIDLMGAPGTLIPAEVPSSILTNIGLDTRGFMSPTDRSGVSCLSHEEGTGNLEVLPTPDRVSGVGSSSLEEALLVDDRTNEDDRKVEKSTNERLEHDLSEPLLSVSKSFESPSGSSRKPSSAQKMKAKSVSKYVISAAKNPEFAQKLHAVLLESGASPPPDLFSGISPLELIEQKLPGHVDDGVQCNPANLSSFNDQFLASSTQVTHLNNAGLDYKHQSSDRFDGIRNQLETHALGSNMSFLSDTTSEGFVIVRKETSEERPIDAMCVNAGPVNPHGMISRDLCEKQNFESLLSSAIDSCQRQFEDVLAIEDKQQCQVKMGETYNDMELGNESASKLIGTSNNCMNIARDCYYERVNPMLGEVAEWEIPWEDLQIGERIGIGSYGEVYCADWNGTEVAVKKFLDQDFSGDALDQFKCEVEIMLRLRHPNVVLFMGAVTRPPHFSILTEFLPRGSLYRLLHRSNSQLDERRRLRMAVDVAKGMNYLHTSHPTIVHRDLKSPNLLVDKNWVVKVCDFGLSRMKHHTFLSSKSAAGTPEWMAPEVLRNEPANEKCDVYSFGVILWELATCRIPWEGLNPMQVVGAVGFQNRRLEIPDDVHPVIGQIMRECWQTEPHLRPSFTQLMSRLRRLLNLLVDGKNSADQVEHPCL